MSRHQGHFSDASYKVPHFSSFNRESQEHIISKPVEFDDEESTGRQSSDTSAPTGITKTTQVKIAYLDGTPVRFNNDIIEVL